MKEHEYVLAYRSWVYACVSAIAERVADSDLHLQESTKDGWIDTQNKTALEALSVLRFVNAYTSFYELIFATQAYLELDGNAFWYLPRSENNKISEIWVLDPTRTAVVKSKSTYIGGFVFTNDSGKDVPLDPEEVIHFKRFNPKNPYRGLGTVQAADIAIDIDTYASAWQRNFFGNSALPASLLYTDGTLNQEQYNRIRSNWDANYRGVLNSNKLGILEGGLKYQSLTPNAREMQFTESRKNSRDEILGIFRVPKILLGISEDVNYASADKVEYVFSKYVIKPKIQFIVGVLNEYYLPLFNLDPQKFRFSFTDPVPENLEQKRLDRESGIKNYYITPNEARAEIGLEPIEGGDELYAPFTVQPLGSAPVQSDTTIPVDPAKSISVKKNYTKLEKSKDQQEKTKAYKDEQAAILKKEYLNLNSDLKTRLLENLKQAKSADNYIQKLAFSIAKETPDELVRLLFENYDDWIGLVYNATKDGLTRILAESGKQTLAQLQVEVDFDLQNPRAVAWLANHAMEDSKSYSDTMKEEIGNLVREGVDQGASIDTIAESISGFFDDQSDWRAERIARTETANAYSQGNLEGYKQSGIVSGKYWVPDAQACEICLGNAAAGVIGLDANFPSGDDAPSAHPHCECDLGGVSEQE